MLKKKKNWYQHLQDAMDEIEKFGPNPVLEAGDLRSLAKVPTGYSPVGARARKKKAKKKYAISRRLPAR